MNFFKRNWILLLIVVVGFFIRIIGITYSGDFPIIVGDEIHTMSATLKMIGTQSLRANVNHYQYPPVLAYIYIPFFVIYLIFGLVFGFFDSINSIKEIVLLNINYFLPLARFVSVFIGTVTILLVYKITIKLFENKNTALIAATLFSLSFAHVEISHFARPWMAQIFFILLVLYWAIVLYKKEELSVKDYIVFGIAIGLAFGVNIVGIFSYYWFVLIHYLKNKNNSFFRSFLVNKYFWITNIFILFIVLLVYYLNPHGVGRYFSIFYSNFSEEVMVHEYSVVSPSFVQTLYFYTKSLVIQNPSIVLLFIFGSICLWNKNKNYFFILTPWVFFYLCLISPLSHPVSRYALPAVSVMIIVSSYFINIFIQNKKTKRPTIFLFIFIIIYMLCLAVCYDIRMLKRDTREIARAWVLDNILSGSTIQNLDFGDSLLLIEDKRSLNFIKENLPSFFSTKRRYLHDLPAEDYPDPSYCLYNYEIDYSEGGKGDFDYAILGSFDMDELREKADKLSANKVLKKSIYPGNDQGYKYYTRSELELSTATDLFNPFGVFKQLKVYGPYIEIYGFEN